MQSVRDAATTIMAFVAVGLTTMLAFTLVAIVYTEVPTANEKAFFLLIGALTTNITAIVSFYYGSSSNDRNKSETIATLATTAASAQAALAPLNEPEISLKAGERATVQAEPAVSTEGDTT